MLGLVFSANTIFCESVRVSVWDRVSVSARVSVLVFGLVFMLGPWRFL